METLQQKEQSTVEKYIFPDFLAKAMAKVDLRTQYEASMMSITLIMVGMVLSVIYAIIYFDFALWFKIVLIVNGLCGIVFMSSSLITTFQQYQNYIDTLKLQKILNGQTRTYIN